MLPVSACALARGHFICPDNARTIFERARALFLESSAPLRLVEVRASFRVSSIQGLTASDRTALPG